MKMRAVAPAFHRFAFFDILPSRPISPTGIDYRGPLFGVPASNFLGKIRFTSPFPSIILFFLSPMVTFLLVPPLMRTSDNLVPLMLIVVTSTPAETPIGKGIYAPIDSRRFALFHV